MKIAINPDTYTVVLTGAGFCISDGTVLYSFTGDDTESFKIYKGHQVNSLAGKTLSAKGKGTVTSVGE